MSEASTPQRSDFDLTMFPTSYCPNTGLFKCTLFRILYRLPFVPADLLSTSYRFGFQIWPVLYCLHSWNLIITASVRWLRVSSLFLPPCSGHSHGNLRFCFASLKCSNARHQETRPWKVWMESEDQHGVFSWFLSSYAAMPTSEAAKNMRLVFQNLGTKRNACLDYLETWRFCFPPLEVKECPSSRNLSMKSLNGICRSASRVLMSHHSYAFWPSKLLRICSWNSITIGWLICLPEIEKGC
jgi:hypothetical protein